MADKITNRDTIRHFLLPVGVGGWVIRGTFKTLTAIMFFLDAAGYTIGPVIALVVGAIVGGFSGNMPLFRERDIVQGSSSSHRHSLSYTYNVSRWAGLSSHEMSQPCCVNQVQNRCHTESNVKGECAQNGTNAVDDLFFLCHSRTFPRQARRLASFLRSL